MTERIIPPPHVPPPHAPCIGSVRSHTGDQNPGQRESSLGWRRRPLRLLFSLAGSVLLGFAGGYLLFHGNTSTDGGAPASSPALHTIRADTGPGEVLASYLEIMDRGDRSGAYGLLSSDDRAITSEEEWEKLTDSPAIHSALKRHASHAVIKETITGDSADVMIETSSADVPLSLFLEASQNDNAKAERELIAYLSADSVPIKKTTTAFRLIKEPSGWRVFLDLASSRRDHTTFAQILTLVKDAQHLTSPFGLGSFPRATGSLGSTEGTLLRAREKLRQAKALYGSLTTIEGSFPGNSTLAEVERQLASLKFFSAYTPFVRVVDVHVDRTSSGQIRILGNIENNGTMTLASVSITIRYLDSHGETLRSETHLPVVVPMLEWEDLYTPETPHYRRLGPFSRRNFIHRVQTLPAEWSGQVEVTLNGLVPDWIESRPLEEWGGP